ncbi:6-phospho-3-hexuloisomerase [Methylomarinovum tepidoasis]|uniref:6-phospho-3-hexuloisomerase n=1 Tax=Methylomarinovum tepidoasis TaxID=2840183 RepID=A0AAU9D0W0_9GAMM|nr:6-phospho-3-hexuloisomerase [Methylomarinovum sp. IN45]BCX88614.1 6-phospho-3-hexuloisomerase [Methylomarinovum sp. IN45]
MNPHRKLVLDKITEILSVTPDEYEDRLTAMVDAAEQVFVGGMGRSGLVTKFFVMRLMHAGYKAFVLGETVTPAIRKGDLFIVISGSGETGSMITNAKKAKEVGAKVVLITAKSSSTLAEIADEVLQIGTDESYAKVKGLPMGTMFELSTLIFLEAMVSHIIHEKGIPEEKMRERHANLE